MPLAVSPEFDPRGISFDRPIDLPPAHPGRRLFDRFARAAGYDPAAIARGSIEHGRIVADMTLWSRSHYARAISSLLAAPESPANDRALGGELVKLRAEEDALRPSQTAAAAARAAAALNTVTDGPRGAGPTAPAPPAIETLPALPSSSPVGGAATAAEIALVERLGLGDAARAPGGSIAARSMDVVRPLAMRALRTPQGVAALIAGGLSAIEIGRLFAAASDPRSAPWLSSDNPDSGIDPPQDNPTPAETREAMRDTGQAIASGASGAPDPEDEEDVVEESPEESVFPDLVLSDRHFPGRLTLPKAAGILCLWGAGPKQ